jgi:murein DD-endopeptidase MepM/ murein hydrolase activator NlpD
MRYKEFVTTESIDRFMGSLLGKSGLGDIIDATSSKDSETDGQTTATTGTSSDGEVKPVDAPVSSKFGFRTSVGKPHNHNGTDFAVPVGTPVKSPQDGVVINTGGGDGRGNYIEVKSSGVVHKFFHLSKIQVSQGQQVKQGQVIGLTGNTGHSTGPHLHWEKHIAGRPVDPMSNIG